MDPDGATPRIPPAGPAEESEDDNPLATYRRREAAAEAVASEWRARSDTLAQWRLAVFLGVVATLVAYAAAPGARPALAAATLVLIAVFVILVVRHRAARRGGRWHCELAQVAKEARFRRLRQWDDLDCSNPTAPHDHPYADDLDVFGHASLYTLLGTTGTRPGAETLTDWLLAPAPPDVVRERQEAVKELVPAIDFRDELQAAGRLAGPVDPEQLQSLLEWAEEAPWLVRDSKLRALAFALPLATVVGSALHILGGPPYLWIAPVIFTLFLIRRHTGHIHGDFSRASRGESGLRQYHTLVARVAAEPFEAHLLAELRESLAPGGEAASEALVRLFRYVEMSDLRFGMLHFPLNVLTLWDVHVLGKMERWKERHGTSVRGWMEALGRVDAVSALAGMAHAHPDWVFPEFEGEGPARLEAVDLGHPLLHPDIGVRNDVEVGPAGTFLLVTGSNMSGKSTLLRALGANIVLAGAGATVCARALKLPSVDLRTSMRIRDSLEEGVSYFMAELQRLKSVAEAASDASHTPVLYLLDEILQGTNTAERQIAARRIIRHLLGQEAIGAVTTHDLSLADAPDLSERAVLVHFRESMEEREDGPPITFDYTLRPGIATSTNALKLMQIMGLAEPEAGSTE